MREISVTATVGEGSERHNHDLDYRATLKHVHERPEGVIELVPYRDYREQINELVRPYIDAYNAKVDQRYQDAWDRYNAGEIKTKPRKRDYPKEKYDYYNEHLHDTFYNRATNKHEEQPMFRELIVGLGDKADRESGVITQEEAVDVLSKVVARFQEDFPSFHVLGATVHVDETGFYHLHLDYKPFYTNNYEQGLGFNIGHESALKHMGLEPEQSIINGRDKVPILFNAFRNKIYYAAEEALSGHGIRLQYGVSQQKDPGKDSSVKQSQEAWLATRTAARELQHQKNVVLDVLAKDKTLPDELKNVAGVINDVSKTLDAIESTPRTRIKGEVKISFHLFDQLKSFVNRLVEAFAALAKDRDIWKNEALQRRSEASRGRYMSDFELETRDAKFRAELENEQTKRENLETYLKERGISDVRIEHIENGTHDFGAR